MNKGYKDLVVWQKSFQLAVDVYGVTKSFPREELYGITSQSRRAAYSIPTNIAEGQCRQHKKEFVQFLGIAFGSGAELETFLLLARALTFLSENDYERLSSKLNEIMRMLNALILKLKSENRQKSNKLVN
ncbi:MAG: four helix bundle protein [bacterium]|nr:four helix bundle protein [bacterium]